MGSDGGEREPGCMAARHSSKVRRRVAKAPGQHPAGLLASSLGSQMHVRQGTCTAASLQRFFNR